MKPGDIVFLKEGIKVEGALTAIKFYKRLYEEVGDSHMLVLEINKRSVLVLVNGYRKVISENYLEVLGESRRID